MGTESRDECSNCGAVVPPHRRKYCNACGPRASAILKKGERERCRRLREGAGNPPYGPGDVPYWLEAWFRQTGSVAAARAAYNAYQRQYMRAYRRRKRRSRNASRSVASPDSNIVRAA